MVRALLTQLGRFAVITGSTVGAVACINIGAHDMLHVEREEKRVPTSMHPRLTLETFDGSIEVSSWDRPEVLVVVEKRGHDREAAMSLKVEISQPSDDEVTVRALPPASEENEFGWTRHRSVAISITAPREALVRAHSGDGRILVRAMRGGLDVETGDGSIRLEDVTGPVDAQSGDGSIVVDGVMTRLRARSGDGSVRVHAGEGSTASDNWSISTGDGSVRVDLPRHFDAELDAHSGDGRVSVDDAALTMHRRDDRSSVRGRLGEGGHDLRVRTGDGSITIRQQ